MAITIPIVDDATGVALKEGDITVMVTHERTGKRLKDANELPVDPPGRWVLATNGDLGTISTAGETLVVEIVRTGRARARYELRVGRDSTQCQMRLLDAPAALRAP